MNIEKEYNSKFRSSAKIQFHPSIGSFFNSSLLEDSDFLGSKLYTKYSCKEKKKNPQMPPSFCNIIATDEIQVHVEVYSFDNPSG